MGWQNFIPTKFEDGAQRCKIFQGEGLDGGGKSKGVQCPHPSPTPQTETLTQIQAHKVIASLLLCTVHIEAYFPILPSPFTILS